MTYFESLIGQQITIETEKGKPVFGKLKKVIPCAQQIYNKKTKKTYDAVHLVVTVNKRKFTSVPYHNI